MLRLSAIALSVQGGHAFAVGAASPTRTHSLASMPVMSSLYDFSANTIDGKAIDFNAFKGKPVLVLNVASL